MPNIGENWLIMPAAPLSPPAQASDQVWLLTLTGLADVLFKGENIVPPQNGWKLGFAAIGPTDFQSPLRFALTRSTPTTPPARFSYGSASGGGKRIRTVGPIEKGRALRPLIKNACCAKERKQVRNRLTAGGSRIRTCAAATVRARCHRSRERAPGDRTQSLTGRRRCRPALYPGRSAPPVRRGTRSSNPFPPSRQSVSLRISPWFLEKPGFSASVGRMPDGAVGRDAQVQQHRAEER